MIFNVALFGAGRIGRIHAHNIDAHPKSRLRYIVDIKQAAASDLAENFGSQTASADEVFADKDIDAVLIASATETHAELIERAARTAKKIFCEKPIDLNLDRVERCLDVVKAYQATLFMGFNRRFDRNFSELKRQLDDGAIGKPELVVINSRDPDLPPLEYIRASGGLFRDMSIHDIDMANWLMGATPATVSANGACLVNPQLAEVQDIDTGVITVQYESGAIAVITNSRRTTYGYDQRIEVHGSQGMLQAANELESTVIKTNQDGIISRKPLHFFLERYANAYRSEWDHFVHVLTGEQALSVSGQVGYDALRIADAALESLKTGTLIRL